jgi:hypothetical protein
MRPAPSAIWCRQLMRAERDKYAKLAKDAQIKIES